ncbi:MAG TPA: translation elongation factor Ts [Candidatus Peribacter riflensis]|uniref:Elongation factor Ts n=1 Tax=Candidatus Peribacter riflensis TaxID=1735162 RepID=A0A0S1STJ5_9BACT|nr:MAG: elongation factor Ts [Candidatus Peribacter riflensis]OGJ78246.1 MAG: translation elongation factor Ts [Candidatus Peribacteria bacterium RIFOXYB1_FULL_57_12]OGJ80660.1 MAG: translation elongation factor Ts [Candidatus Peribacteria bacterium RIFOXYC1_FULL_58_8]ALM10771.1 MAG: elongation factor Ts [Candidatus Peribacter riflensis]ALM11873.1 MAG: elongation factor Ts [Candidatus Peribacter riflensis]
MSPISASAVSSLRQRTGVSMMECKKALDEAQGNEEKAIEILRKRGIAQAAKKAARDQFEGLIFLAQGAGKAALVLLKCETDFVARDENFRKAGSALVDELLQKGEAALKALGEKTVPALVQKLGENISIGEARLVTGQTLGTYLHTNSKIGVVISLEGGTEDSARDVAMHAAAMNPTVTRPEEVTAEKVEKEKEIWREQLKKEGKPEAMFDKIMLGKEKKFREENALVKQTFVKDPSKTVEQFLGTAKVAAYVRLAVS